MSPRSLQVSATFLLATLAASAVSQEAAVSQPAPAEKDPWLETREERIAWWNEARFGMFIHWGLYAIPAGEWEGERVKGIGEWILHHGQIPVSDYQPLADRFNPTAFDADEWVRLMKEAGCRYFVITTKHHDGFALFRSDASDYDIANTPFGAGNERDLMRELADAARKHGVRIGWYHSVMDWQHPDYLPRRDWEDRPAEGADYGRFVEYLHAQVEEILTNYGPIDLLWFDGEWEGTWTHEHGVALHEHCMGLNPELIVNNRVDKGRKGMQGMNKEGAFRGDFGTPEQEIPEAGFGPGVYWESCMTMNDTWGYKSYDDNWKSDTKLIRNLIDTASKGGNYLLNVGPTALGEIPQPSQERLREMGRWLKVNGEAIYGTEASPFGSLDWGRVTGKRLPGDQYAYYLHVFDWPSDGRLVLPAIQNLVLEASALNPERNSQVREARTGSQGIEVHLQGEPWDRHASVVKLVVESKRVSPAQND